VFSRLAGRKGTSGDSSLEQQILADCAIRAEFTDVAQPVVDNEQAPGSRTQRFSGDRRQATERPWLRSITPASHTAR
jgi:hypothetical protein